MLIVSLTTIPPRVKDLGFVIESIASQSVSVDKIELNIPIKYDRNDLGSIDEAKLPKNCDIYWVDRDYGPATKILPTVARYWGQDVDIIFCDDDRLYDKDWVKRLTETAAANPYCCIAEEAMNANRRLESIKWRKRPFLYRLLRVLSLLRFKPTKCLPDELPNIAEGYGGCLVKPNFFCDKVFDIPLGQRLVDDIWLSGNLALNNIVIKKTLRSAEECSRPVERFFDVITEDYALKNQTQDGYRRLDLDESAIKWFQKQHKIWND
jgi:hypothetical protein